MKTPSGMTEEQVMKQIKIVIDRIAPKYTFYGFSVDDIKQESFIICMEALNRYDGIRPLENFLSVNLSNRLKNFVRDNHFISDENLARQKVYQPAQLEYEESIVDSEEKFSSSYESMEYTNMANILDKNLPAKDRMDYLKMINDVYITKQRREEVTEVICQILSEYGYDENW